MGLTLVTPPDGEPVVATEVINHLRLEDDTTEDSLLDALAAAARQIVESGTNRVLLTQTWDYTLDHFPGCGAGSYGDRRGTIWLPYPPLQSVTYVKYVDMGGMLQTMPTSDYLVDTSGVRGRITLGYAKFWPLTRGQASAVTVRFVAGYGDASKVPDALKAAMLLIVGGLYENRESIITGMTVAENPAVQALLNPFRVLGAV